jgi:hypothetical protein
MVMSSKLTKITADTRAQFSSYCRSTGLMPNAILLDYGKILIIKSSCIVSCNDSKSWIDAMVFMGLRVFPSRQNNCLEVFYSLSAKAEEDSKP